MLIKTCQGLQCVIERNQFGASLDGATASFEPVGGAEGAPVALAPGEGPVLVVRKGPQTGETFFVDLSSPVQAGIINDEIRRLRGKYPDTPLYAVVEDVCASGGYYVAAAADKIYVDKASLVGSIGVLMDGFGFTGAMEKLGIERRLYTSGERKAMLDPFLPEKEVPLFPAWTGGGASWLPVFVPGYILLPS